ncbi:hypothetical protein [uncultured Shewanella sp.]|uniref:hypothetical protein n=1 Tax=uncultured Shewanella sp. TaxID=173975 RepID=UPI0026156F48|nr:hypothetical protein [uncultured Shewanella sp.]
MNKNRDIQYIRQALDCLVKAEKVTTDSNIFQGLEPELNTLSTIIKKDLFRRINNEN